MPLWDISDDDLEEETPMNADLTKCEKQILALRVLGMSRQEMADFLVVSIETVNTHLKHIKRKMGEEFPAAVSGGRKAVGSPLSANNRSTAIETPGKVKW